MAEETEIALRSELAHIEQVAQIVITDQVSYTSATHLLLNVIQPLRKRWKDYWYNETSGPVKLSYRAYQAALEKFKEYDESTERAEKTVKATIFRWQQEQDRIQQEAQRKAQAEAEAKERADREAEAFFAEQAGAPAEEIQAIATAPTVAVAEPVEPTYIRNRAIVTRKNWVCEVTDLKALCKAIGAGKVPTSYVLPNESVLNARAKADELTMNVPGCKAVNRPIVSGGKR